ncbi:hypothetical protein GQ43DRAFT_425305 [Delitschia confertaspora ATCC 74209]|uniref:Protein kinase domain-containing protein n=1 Tax=Delitschia confertaspora ATCC 74209 TaxID=1513339 RepID=A0A9P4MNG1_9PLEO|nr:hypothetical protein GQ43DRAFT_425305 [Delitschia confertaspora ATCC 74209]
MDQYFTIRIGTQSLPMRGRQLIAGPVFEAWRIPSHSRLLPSCIQQWLRDVVPHILPFRIQGWLRKAFPAWFLPTRLIVKELDPKNPAAFDTEGRIYAILQHLQGRSIPIYYGTAQIEHSGETGTHQAHLLEFLEGTPLAECTKEQSIRLRTEEKMKEVYDRLSECKVVQGDAWPRHIIHTKEGALKIIDFGEAYETGDIDGASDLNRGDAEDVLYRFGCVNVIG